MAAIQGSFTRSQTSTPNTRKQPGVAVPQAVQPISPNRQSTLRGRLRLAKEPEDARITGGTRSLDRRLLGLNLAGPRPANAA